MCFLDCLLLDVCSQERYSKLSSVHSLQDLQYLCQILQRMMNVPQGSISILGKDVIFASGSPFKDVDLDHSRK